MAPDDDEKGEAPNEAKSEPEIKPEPEAKAEPKPEPEPEPEPEPDSDDEPLPPAPKPAELPALVGARPLPPPPGARRRMWIAIGAGLFVVLTAATVVLSWLNSRDFYFVCGSTQVTAERGSRWPWGRTRLTGAKWRPIAIPPNAQCEDQTLATEGELEEEFLRTLLAQTGVRLQSADPADIDEAERQLEQAMILTRPHPDRRGPIERLLGDVEYWRAASEVKLAVDKLTAAGERFDRAAAKRPTQKGDAPAWATFARHLVEEIKKGPPELRPDRPILVGPSTEVPFAGTGPGDVVARPPVEPGVALPPQADAAPPPIDAGLPTGGVLL